MSQNNSSTAKDNIALVQGDKARRYGQIVIIFCLIFFSLGFVAWYAYDKADDQFLLYMAVGLLAILFAGIGAAYSNMGLGRTVGSAANGNSADPANIEKIMIALLASKGVTFRKDDPLDSFPDIEQPTTPTDGDSDEVNTLHEEMPEEVPPGRD